MALPLPAGLSPAEVAFLCEMELVTVIPRQRLEGLELLGGSIPPLQPPYRSTIPLWLALLLKRQRRANIIPPPWLSPHSLDSLLKQETSMTPFTPPPPPPTTTTTTNIQHPSSVSTLSPPFLSSATADATPDALPYHWLELGEILLDAAADDIPEPNSVRRLMRDLREVRMAKLRAGVDMLEGGREVKMNGVGGMEIAEGRAFIVGVVDGLRKIGASKELSRKEREAEERENGIGGGGDEDDDDDDDDGMDI